MITKIKTTAYIVLLFLSFSLPVSYCHSQGTWTQMASLPASARLDAMYFTIGSKGYVVAGMTQSFNAFKDVWEYDATNNIWNQKQNFTGRWQGVSFSIGTKGYAGTGRDSAGNYKNDFWEYDPAADTWTQKASFSGGGRDAAVGFSIGTKGYLGTGLSPATANNDFWEYDPVLNLWTQKANVPGARSFAFGLSIGAKGYIGTGQDSTGSNQRDDFLEYDPSSDIWTQKTNFPGGLTMDIDGEHFTIGNYGYVGKGNNFWKYDPANNIWTSITNLPALGRIGAIGFSINNKGYIGLGYANPSTILNDLWEYSFDSTGIGVNEVANKPKAVLYQNAPNPFGDGTTIRYFIPENSSDAQIVFFDEFGNKLKEFTVAEKGMGQLNISATNLAVGVYYYQLQTGKGAVGSKKMVVIK